MKKQSCIGASVLPYSIVDGNIFMLLGREKCYKPKGKKSDHQWSDFGGKSEGETEIDCASREFEEETMSLVRFFENEVLPRENVDDLKSRLSDNMYTFKVKFPVNENGYYVTYITRVPYDPYVPSNFSTLSNAFSIIHSVGKHPAMDININHAYLEKTDLRWVSIPNLTIACESNGTLPLSIYTYKSKLRSHFLYRLRFILSLFPESFKYKTNWRIDPKNRHSDFENFNNKYRYK